ncbi:MAG: small basic protein [Candidatus Omnitrophica bacterium]|nr:small basic protein [Candidatus Omnitrophota bacterium]
MSIHPSLSSSAKDKKSRSVLKRVERLKMLIEKGTWSEGKSIFGLPKIKTLKIKIIKKEKAAPAAAAAPGAEGAATKGATEVTPAAEKPAKSSTSKESKK